MSSEILLSKVTIQDSAGRPVKASIFCEGELMGVTDSSTGILEFELPRSGPYKILAKYFSHHAYGVLVAGKDLELRLCTD